MPEIAELGLVINYTSADTAARSLDGLVASSGRAETSNKSLTRSMDQVVDHFNQLRQQSQLGGMSLGQFKDHGNAALQQMRTLASQTRMTAEEERYFAEQTQMMANAMRATETAALRQQNAMARTAFGVQTLTASMASGSTVAGGLTSALGMLGGGPWVVGITTALMVGINLFQLFGHESEKAAKQAQKALEDAAKAGQRAVADFQGNLAGLREHAFLGRDLIPGQLAEQLANVRAQIAAIVAQTRVLGASGIQITTDADIARLKILHELLVIIAPKAGDARVQMLKGLQDELAMTNLLLPDLEAERLAREGIGQATQRQAEELRRAIGVKQQSLALDQGLARVQQDMTRSIDDVVRAHDRAKTLDVDARVSGQAHPWTKELAEQLYQLRFQERQAWQQMIADMARGVTELKAEIQRKLQDAPGGYKKSGLNGEGDLKGLYPGLINAFNGAASGTSFAGMSELFTSLAKVNPLAGAAAGALGGVADALLGNAMAMEQWRQKVKQFQQSMTEWEHQAFGGTTLQQQEDAAQARALAQREQLRELYGGNPGRVPDYIRELARINATLAADLARIKADWDRSWRRGSEDLDVRMARATGSSGADDLALYRQQQREMEDAIRGGADAPYQAKLAEVQLAEVRARAMEKLKTQIDGFTSTIGTLQTFRDSLALNRSLSILSPIQQLAESRRQYEQVLAAARNGDQAQAGKLPAVAQAFLEASRAVNASGMGYVSDFNRVRADTDAVLKMFEDARTTAQQQLDLMKQQNDTLVEIGDTLADTLTAYVAGQKANADGLVALRLEVSDLASILKRGGAAGTN